MATDKVTIFNQALAAIGGEGRVQDPAEVSPEAEVCSLWYDHVLETVLAAAPWHEATAYRRIAVQAERDFDEAWVSTDPPPGYRYIYGAPSDMLRPRFLSDYSRFEMTNRSDTKAIATNTEDAILVYTKLIDNPSLWTADLRNAIIHGLAGMICMGINAKVNRQAAELELANGILRSARASNANDQQLTLDVLPPWLSARGYGDPVPQTRYFYPNGNLFVVDGLA